MKTSTKKILGLVCLAAVVIVGYVVNDGQQSVKKFNAAAEHGDAATQTSLGVYYYQGTLFPKNYTKAMHWWLRAANQGYAEAQFSVGHMYWFAEGVPKDAIQAYMWATLAAQQNYDRAIKSIPQIEKSMTPDQIAEAKRRAAEWKPTSETHSEPTPQ